MKLTEEDMCRVDGVIGRVISQHTNMHGRLRKDIYALIRAERERCAKIAEEYCDPVGIAFEGGNDGPEIAAKIRSGE